MLKIGIDAMGGDYAPAAVVEGAVAALPEIGSDSKIVLFGRKADIEAVLAENGAGADRFDIVDCSEVIEMQDHPAQSFAKKTDSSIVVGFEYLRKGRIDGFASAGSTGAMMVGCMYAIKTMEGIIRPGISAHMRAANGNDVLLLDVGLNADCKPDVLYQYGLIGSVYAKNVFGIEKPRVALLNIGEEREKGNLVTKAAYELMEDTDKFNFVGNIESKYVFSGETADVIVCDGFVGNVIIKMAEGIYEISRAQGVKNDFFDSLNYEMVGGTPVLGINGTVMIGHGCSSPLAIKNMILETERTIEGRFVDKLRETID